MIVYTLSRPLSLCHSNLENITSVEATNNSAVGNLFTNDGNLLTNSFFMRNFKFLIIYYFIRAFDLTSTSSIENAVKTTSNGNESSTRTCDVICAVYTQIPNLNFQSSSVPCIIISSK